MDERPVWFAFWRKRLMHITLTAAGRPPEAFSRVTALCGAEGQSTWEYRSSGIPLPGMKICRACEDQLTVFVEAGEVVLTVAQRQYR